MLHTFDLVGEPPPLNGAVVQELIAEEFRFTDSVCSPHIVWLRLEGQWWRIFADGPMLYWQSSDAAPLAWEVPEEGLFAPLRDLGEETGLRGQTLTGWFYVVRQDTPSLSLQFQDGRQISFFGSDHSWREFEVVQWTFNPGRRRVL